MIYKKKLIAVISAALAAQSWAGDTLYKNADFYTVDAQNPHAEAMVTNGKTIEFIGSLAEAEKHLDQGGKTVDLEGAFVMPAMIDSHTHPGLVASTAGNTELAKYTLPTSSKEETYAYLRKIAQENPNLPFLMVGQWNNPLWGVKGPDRKSIDEIFPNTAVILLDSSGHSYWLNTAAFKALGIDENTPDLKEGLSFFVKDEHGRKTGWVKEFALMPFIESMITPDVNALKTGLVDYLNFLANKGISTVMDAGNFGAENNVYEAVHQLDQEGKLPVRYEATHHLYKPSQIKDAVDTVLQLRKKYGSDLLTFNTIKIHFDGVNEINTAAVLEDFANEPGNKGGMLYDEDELKDLLLEAAKHNINVHLHTVGDRSTRTALNAMEKAEKAYGGKLPLQLTLSHLEVVNPDDMPRFKALGVNANFTPHWLGGTVFSGSHEALGDDRFAHDQPVNSLIKAGANVTYSSDVVSMPQAYRANPFMGIQMGATRQEPALGKDAPIFGQPSDRASIENMIKGYTINNAKQLAMSEKIGSLTAGKSADFIVLPQNIFKMDVYDISHIQPKKVYFQGQPVQLKTTIHAPKE